MVAWEPPSSQGMDLAGALLPLDAIDENDPIGGRCGFVKPDASIWPHFPPQVSGSLQALLEVLPGPGHTSQVVVQVPDQGVHVPWQH